MCVSFYFQTFSSKHCYDWCLYSGKAPHIYNLRHRHPLWWWDCQIGIVSITKEIKHRRAQISTYNNYSRPWQYVNLQIIIPLCKHRIYWLYSLMYRSNLNWLFVIGNYWPVSLIIFNLFYNQQKRHWLCPIVQSEQTKTPTFVTRLKKL